MQCFISTQQLQARHLKQDFIPRIFIKLSVLQVYLTLNQWQKTDNNHAD